MPSLLVEAEEKSWHDVHLTQLRQVHMNEQARTKLILMNILILMIRWSYNEWPTYIYIDVFRTKHKRKLQTLITGNRDFSCVYIIYTTLHRIDIDI